MRTWVASDVFASLVFALTMTAVPWTELKPNAFPDIENYREIIENLAYYGDDYYEIGMSWIDRLKAEYLWFWLMNLIATSGIEPSVAFDFITAFSSFVYHRYLANKIGNVLAFVLLFNPIVIDLLREQLRSALAFSIFLLAFLLTKRRKIQYLIFAPTFYIHSSMAANVILFQLSDFMSGMQRISSTQKALLAAAVALVFAWALVVVAPSIMDSVTDRRYAYVATLDTYGDSRLYRYSLAYLSFWILLGLLLVVATLHSKAVVNWSYIFSIVICFGVPIAELGGFPSFRFIALAFPLIIASVAYEEKGYDILGYVALGTYQVLQFNYWLR
jgi:hypothetical protein